MICRIERPASSSAYSFRQALGANDVIKQALGDGCGKQVYPTLAASMTQPNTRSLGIYLMTPDSFRKAVVSLAKPFMNLTYSV